ncbi:MAG: flippase [Gemmatimonadales bacterium]|jgi:O-antigen/teichoic acid export membrane protein
MLDRVLPADVTTRLAGSAAGSLVLRVGGAALGLGVSILLARLLGAQGYGVYAFAYGLVSLLALPAQAGLPILLVREVARYEVEGEWGLLRGLLRRSNQLVALLTTLIVAVALLLMFVFDVGFTPAQRATFSWALALLPVMALSNLRGATLRGLRKVVQGQLPDALIRPGLLVAALLAFVPILGAPAIGDVELTPPLAMAMHAGAALVALLVGIWMLRRQLPGVIATSRRAYRTRVWLRSLLPLTLLAGLAMINNQMDVVMLGVLGPPADVGVYKVAFSASTPIVFALGAINVVVAPYFSRAYASGDRGALQRLATWSARVSIAVALPGAVVLILFGGPLLDFVFGSEFARGASALALLVGGNLIAVAAGSVGNILNMTGHEGDTVFASGVAALSNLVLNLALIPVLGIRGAAAATALSLVLWNVILVFRVHSRVGVISLAWYPGRR